MEPRELTVSSTAVDLELLVGRLRRRMRREAPPEGVTSSQMSALARLVREGPMTAADLAAGEHVRPQSIALTVGHLVDLKFVSRSSDPADGRRVLVTPTDDGVEFIDHLRRSRQAWLSRAVDRCLTDDEKKILDASMALLDRLVEWTDDADVHQTRTPPEPTTRHPRRTP